MPIDLIQNFHPTVVAPNGAASTPTPEISSILIWGNQFTNDEWYITARLFFGRQPSGTEHWLATVVGMRVHGLTATYVIGDTYQVDFPGGQFDQDLERDLRDEFRRIIPRQRP